MVGGVVQRQTVQPFSPLHRLSDVNLWPPEGSQEKKAHWNGRFLHVVNLVNL